MTTNQNRTIPVKHNMGHYNSVRHEFLLVAARGSCQPDVMKLFDSVITIERNGQHSQKPTYFREIIDTLYPYGPRIELAMVMRGVPACAETSPPLTPSYRKERN